jgi:2',3'-cyclic-nucleotide 2'-phosphodiesterase/3'-nucleotidase
MSNYQIRILETSDIHAYIEDYDYYTNQPKNQGLVYVKTAADQKRQELIDQGYPAESIIQLDAGDLIQGSSLGNYLVEQAYTPGATHGTGTWSTEGVPPTNKMPIYGSLEILGTDVSTLGNHEFNFGLDYIDSSIAGADLPVLSANVFHDPDNSIGAPADEPRFQEYEILEAKAHNPETGETENIKIGVAGFVTEGIMGFDAKHLVGEAYTERVTETATRLVDEMRAAGADLIFGITHTDHGNEEDPNLAEYLHDTSRGVAEIDTDNDGKPDYDALFGGHEHKRNDGTIPSELNGVPFLMSGSWGDTLGVMDLNLTKDEAGNWSIADHETTFVDIKGQNEAEETVPLFEANQELRDYIAPWHEATINYMGQQIAEISDPMSSYFAHGFDDPLLETFAAIQIAYGKDYLEREDSIFTDKTLPVLSVATGYKGGREGGTDYTVIESPEMLNRDVASMYIYDNNVASIVQITGAELEDYLEFSAFQTYNTIDPNSSEPQQLNKVPEVSRGYNVDAIKAEDGALTYEIDVTQEPEFNESGPTGNEGRIINLEYNDEPIEATDEFYLVLNNYRSNGGGGYPIEWEQKVADGKLYLSPDANQKVFADYFAAAEGVVDTSLVDDEPTFRPVVGADDSAVEVVYVTSNNEDAQSTYAPRVGATYVSDYRNAQGENDINGKSGFANYTVTIDPTTQSPSVQPDPEDTSSSEIIFGTPGSDRFDSVSTTNDFTGDAQILTLGSGEDFVDVALADGGNRIDLGSDADLIFAGTNNRILAGPGNDILFINGNDGNNIVTGGQGEDQFWIVTDTQDLVTTPNLITDFIIGDDVIGFANTDLDFSSLTLTQVDGDVVIKALDQDLAILANLEVANLTGDSFAFV